MIYYKTGDLFDTPAVIRVNTVNCKGVMGAGVALAFKARYPAMFSAYVQDCEDGLIKPGCPTVWFEYGTARGDPTTIINFPTKNHWRKPSEYQYVEDGLRWLRSYLKPLGAISLVLPALGCGHGKLEWPRVRAMIEQYLSDLNAEIYVFDPASSHLVGKIVRGQMGDPGNI